MTLPAPLLSASSIKGFCFFFSGSSGVGVNEELQSKALHKLRFNHKKATNHKKKKLKKEATTTDFLDCSTLCRSDIAAKLFTVLVLRDNFEKKDFLFLPT
jgi:hypothetical protein